LKNPPILITLAAAFSAARILVFQIANTAGKTPKACCRAFRVRIFILCKGFLRGNIFFMGGFVSAFRAAAPECL